MDIPYKQQYQFSNACLDVSYYGLENVAKILITFEGDAIIVKDVRVIKCEIQSKYHPRLQ